MKRLVIFSHKLFRDTPAGYQTNGGITVQLDALAPYFSEVTLCVPVTRDADFQGVGVSAPNIKFQPLPYCEDRLDFIRVGMTIRKNMLKAIKQADLGLVLLPSYIGLLASVLCQRRNFPIFQWIVGNWSRNVVIQRGTAYSRWIAFRFITPIISWLIKRLTRDILTFYNGQILYDQGKPYHYIRISSSINLSDIYVCQDDIHSPFKLLYVGRLSPEKGIPDLLEAVAIMDAIGEDVMLNIVGTGELENVLKQQTTQLDITSRIEFHGYVPRDELFSNIYRSSDILILPSHVDQQPKVLIEGMSQSIPVIATNVGGVPFIIQDGVNGLLIQPGQPEDIVRAYQRIVTDNELRQRLVLNGLKFARAHIVEEETAKMIKIVNDYFFGDDVLQL